SLCTPNCAEPAVASGRVPGGHAPGSRSGGSPVASPAPRRAASTGIRKLPSGCTSLSTPPDRLPFATCTSNRRLLVQVANGSRSGGVESEVQPDGSFLIPVEAALRGAGEATGEPPLLDPGAWPPGTRPEATAGSAQFGVQRL